MNKNFGIKNISKFAKEGIFTNNPILIQTLGMCPTLATTTSVKNGLGMGVSAMLVLIFSNLLISLLSKIIPKQIRIACYIVVISGLVTIIDMLLSAYIPALAKSLGLFIPLIVVNCIILARAEAFASKNDPVSSVLDGLFMGIGFAFALFLISSVREIVGSGSFFGLRIFSPDFAAGMFVSPPGAFITLGILVAVFKSAISYAGKKSKKEKAENIKETNETKEAAEGENS